MKAGTQRTIYDIKTIVRMGAAGLVKGVLGAKYIFDWETTNGADVFVGNLYFEMC